MPLKLKLLVLILFWTFGCTTAVAQEATEKQVILAVSGGASYLPLENRFLDSDYKEQLQLGYAFGSEILFFIKNFGLGFVFEETRFSGDDRTLGLDRIDEKFRVQFYGPSIATRVPLNKYHSFTFSFSYGRARIIAEATDGDVTGEFDQKSFVPRFSVNYEWRFERLGFRTSLAYTNGDEPKFPTFSAGIGSIGPVSNAFYDPGIDFTRLSLAVGINYRISDLFL